jgi:glycosyltransferase involved in cell wall biosynthesis
MAPAAIASAGYLHRLYTDFCVLPSERRLLAKMPLSLFPISMRRLLGRRIPDEIPPHTFKRFALSTFRDYSFLKHHPAEAKNTKAWYDRHLGGHYLSDRLIENDFDGANALYVHPCVSTRAIKEAHRRGMPIIYESISHPKDQFIEAQEYERFGRPYPLKRDLMEMNLKWFLDEIRHSSVVLAASNYSKSGLLDVGVQADKVCVVPYGLPLKFYEQEPRPVKGRILFVGTVGYRKGLPDLAAAARLLSRSHPQYEIRVAGPIGVDIANRPEFHGPNYLGQVPREEIKKEFLSADVFVFPTISDAFGIVLMEALAAGLPIISTKNCADVVVEGENGLHVPTRDPAAIADGICHIVENRELRNSMGECSKLMVDRFSPVSYRDRMANVLSKLG